MILAANVVKLGGYKVEQGGIFKSALLRNVDELTSASRRTDLGQACSIYNHKSRRNSELFQDFCDCRSGKDGLML